MQATQVLDVALNRGVGSVQLRQDVPLKNGVSGGHGELEVERFPIVLFCPSGFEPLGVALTGTQL